SLAQARREGLPQLSVDVEVDALDRGGAPTDVRAGLSLELPLFGRGGARVDAGRAAVRAAQAEHGATRARLEGALVAAQRRLAAAVERARAFRDQVLPAQERAAALAVRA